MIRLLHRREYLHFCIILLICLSGMVYADEEEAFILVENRTEHIAKIAVPGAKPARISPGETAYKLILEPTEPNGVDAKIWWVSDPRRLCIIFVRYGGKVVIAGKTDIKCLGN